MPTTSDRGPVAEWFRTFAVVLGVLVALAVSYFAIVAAFAWGQLPGIVAVLVFAAAAITTVDVWGRR